MTNQINNIAHFCVLRLFLKILQQHKVQHFPSSPDRYSSSLRIYIFYDELKKYLQKSEASRRTRHGPHQRSQSRISLVYRVWQHIYGKPLHRLGQLLPLQDPAQHLAALTENDKKS